VASALPLLMTFDRPMTDMTLNSSAVSSRAKAFCFVRHSPSRPDNPLEVRVSSKIDSARLASIAEEHTASGAHRKVETPFADWVPDEELLAARALTAEDALAFLPAWLAESI
jgi:hypothetical protein